MRRMLFAALCSLAAPGAFAGDSLETRQAASQEVIKEFSGRLRSELERAMQEGGPARAVEVCRRIAPGIAEEQSRKTGWRVARTSLRTRNPANAPDAWESRVLNRFEERKAQGEAVENLVFGEVVERGGRRSFRFMKAIPTGELCLQCHGPELKPEVAAKLAVLYPEDRARGFKPGDLRGAFTITQPISE